MAIIIEKEIEKECASIVYQECANVVIQQYTAYKL